MICNGTIMQIILCYLFERLFYSKGHFQLPYGCRCVNEMTKAFVSMVAAM